jgi:hypothetical protein
VLNEKHPAVTGEVRRAVEERRKALVEEAK